MFQKYFKKITRYNIYHYRNDMPAAAEKENNEDLISSDSSGKKNNLTENALHPHDDSAIFPRSLTESDNRIGDTDGPSNKNNSLSISDSADMLSIENERIDVVNCNQSDCDKETRKRYVNINYCIKIWVTVLQYHVIYNWIP